MACHIRRGQMLLYANVDIELIHQPSAREVAGYMLLSPLFLLADFYLIMG